MPTKQRVMKADPPPSNTSANASTAPTATRVPSWLDNVRLEMMHRGWSNRDLAKQIGKSAATITRFFDGTASQRIAALVSAAVQVPQPGSDGTAGDYTDARRQEWAALGESLHALDAQRYERIVAACRELIALGVAAEKLYAALRP